MVTSRVLAHKPGDPLLLTLIPKLLPFLKARQQSKPLLRSVHELPKANSVATGSSFASQLLLL